MRLILLAAAMAAVCLPVHAESETSSIGDEVENLKAEVIALNRDLFVLEEELLFPANTQTFFFVSMDVGEFFALDSVKLKVNDKEVAHYLYTEHEADALVRGGVHRLHVDNLKSGEHELVAVFTGKGPHEREYKRGATLTFEKGSGPKYVELRIEDTTRKLQPEFAIREWD